MGIGETIKGAAKEKVGDLLGDDNRKNEGDAQETEGQEQTAAAEDRAAATRQQKDASAATIACPGPSASGPVPLTVWD